MRLGINADQTDKALGDENEGLMSDDLWVIQRFIVFSDITQQDAVFVKFPSHPDVHVDARLEYTFTSFDFFGSQRWMFRIVGQKIELLLQCFFYFDRQTVNALKKEV